MLLSSLRSNRCEFGHKPPWSFGKGKPSLRVFTPGEMREQRHTSRVFFKKGSLGTHVWLHRLPVPCGVEVPAGALPCIAEIGVCLKT